MEAKGPFIRNQNETDRCAKALALTEAGTALQQGLLPHVREIQPDILPGLSGAERTEFIRLATKMAEAGNASCPCATGRQAPHAMS